jgi:Domain of unknown function (DUF4405)
MKISRDWSTPLTIGAFALLSLTGILMFFHLDTGLNKVAHEWLSWVLIAAVGLHVTSHLPAFKRYLAQTRARWLIGGALALLAASFLPVGGASGEPPFMAPVKALAAAPVSTLALVAGVSPLEMRARLKEAGLEVSSEAQSVQTLAGPDRRRQIQVLSKVLTVPAVASAGG